MYFPSTKNDGVFFSYPKALESVFFLHNLGG
jgi:hypothetical protein